MLVVLAMSTTRRRWPSADPAVLRASVSDDVRLVGQLEHLAVGDLLGLRPRLSADLTVALDLGVDRPALGPAAMALTSPSAGLARHLRSGPTAGHEGIVRDRHDLGKHSLHRLGVDANLSQGGGMIS